MRHLGLFCCAFLFLASAARADDETSAIREVLDRYAAAWNRDDAQTMAAVFAPEGDIVSPYGQVVKGREAVSALLMREHSGWAKGTRYSDTVDSLRMIKPEVALVDGKLSVRGANLKKPLEGRFTNVLVKSDGRWWIQARRVMLIVSEPGSAGQAPAQPANR
jgi:uncharacterized protein (TIGR02246 family)